MRVGFIGLGHMGAPMVLNLLAHAVPVKVLDVAPTAVQSLVQQGAIGASSILDIAKDCDVVFTMVQTGEQVMQCCLGEQGLFAHLKPGALFMDCSTIDVESSKKLHQLAEQQGIAMLDAPVSGGVGAAKAATLTFMVGGSEENFARAQPLLTFLGKNIIYAGLSGSGVCAKICNNMILGISMIAVSEGFVLADKLGLSAEKLFEICNAASGQCWSLSKYCPWPNILENVPSSHDYQPGFTAQMMLKDLKLSQDAAHFAKTFTPLGKHATALYQQFVEAGNAELDFSGILRMLK